MPKDILLICYYFPPYPDIGGRRWAKFAKYLKNRGHHVTVISAENPFPGSVSEWNKDVAGIENKKLPANYPEALITYPPGIIGKISYRLALMKVKRKGKGNYYDRGLFWETQLLSAASDIILRKKIRNIIVSGAPFHLTYHACRLKEKFPDLNLIIDFRDFWTKDISLSALGTMPKERVEEEKRMEKYVCETADKIICVSDEMTDYFNSISSTKKASTILNGFDPDDFSGLKIEERGSEKKIRFVFGGNLYNNLENIFNPFCNALAEIKQQQPELYAKLDFRFFGTSSVSQREFAASQNLDCITFHKSIPLHNMLEQIFNADYCMLFLNNVYAFSLSTKFCEYIAMKKNVVLFSVQGKASDFITENRLGCWINPSQTKRDLLSLIEKHLSGQTEPANTNFDYSRFSLDKITTELEAILI